MSENAAKAIEIQESILADLEELLIGCELRPKKTVEEAVHARISELRKTIAMLKKEQV